MSFTDPSFILAFCLLFLASAALRRLRWFHAEKVVTVAFSLALIYSYGALDVGAFVLAVFANYVAAGVLDRAEGRARSRLLYLIVAANIGYLAYFKYRVFVVHDVLGVAAGAPATALLIPLGVSFYTFHIISYQVDLHARRIARASFLDFSLYLAFFPHLIAGPIMRGAQLIPQLVMQQARRVRFTAGAFCFVTGMFLKLGCADPIGAAIDPFWREGGAAQLSAAGHWAVVLLYYAQIYADFAGYSLMAIGMAHLLGYTLPENFLGPMTATSLREFWRRWHVTLSSWLRDYLYIALGGSRHGRARTYTALIVTMALGGLWHGAGWTFVIWGLMHGAGLAIERLARGERPCPPLPALGGLLVTQAWVMLAWVFFRAPSLDVALDFLGGMFRPGSGALPAELVVPLGLTTLVVLHNVCTRGGRDRILSRPALAGVLCGVLLAAVLAAPSYRTLFIYFTF